MKIYLIRIADHPHIILNGFIKEEDAKEYVSLMEENGTRCCIELNKTDDKEITW